MKEINRLIWAAFIALAFAACSSKPSATDEAGLDSETVDQELASLDDQSPSMDETSAGFSEDVAPAEIDTSGDTISQVENNLGESSTPIVEAPVDGAAGVDLGSPSEVPFDSAPINSDVGNTDVGSNFEPKEIKAPKVAAAPPVASLTKIELAPFEREGALLNAVYIVRPKDTFSKISEKIFGANNRVSDLKKWNPAVSTPKVGSKIYYNSPSRPQDSTSLKVYYEDMGLIPQTYISQKEEPLRAKAKELLGFSEAWKEIWSTHPRLESKTTLPMGAEIYYWPDMETPSLPTQVLAETPVNSVPAANDFPPPPPPPPMPDMNSEANDFANNNEMTPPPPPPPSNMDASAPVAVAASVDGEEESQEQMMMMLGAGGILMAGIAGLIVIRKRKQQREAAALAAMESTNVGT